MVRVGRCSREQLPTHPLLSAEDLLDRRAPINVKFEIPYFTVSGIQVRYLKIVEKSGYQALREWLVRRMMSHCRRQTGLTLTATTSMGAVHHPARRVRPTNTERQGPGETGALCFLTAPVCMPCALHESDELLMSWPRPHEEGGEGAPRVAQHVSPATR